VSSAGLEDGVSAERLAVGFATVLRRAGVGVSTASVVDFAAALGLLGVGSRSAVYHAGAATLVQRREDLVTYGEAFAAFWEGAPVPPLLGPAPAGPPPAPVGADDGGPAGHRLAEAGRVLRWSDVEVLRHRDLASLDPAERRQLDRLLDRVRVTTPPRRTRRTRATRRDGTRLDLPATVRRSLRTDGMVLDRAWRRPAARPRRLVVLLDVSGSMEPYAHAALRVAHRAVAAGRVGDVEVFALGTRLTRLTRQLAWRHADAAVAAAAADVVDYAGGTRLGDGLAAFNDRWGVRGVARGAVVVIVSDGWDRGDPGRLGAEMARLHRVAHRVVWVNPLKASPGYAPLARGMAAALPHVDDFVEGHSAASLEVLAAVAAGRPR
jgi:uncharacterized protein with von Willebrand factor type A (vWA) domain